MGASDLFLGGVIDSATGDRKGQSLNLDAGDLTTHGVIVGMTGSGKTGLGVVLLEELLLAGVPTLIIDPKGDMGNLKLRFPNLLPADFQPWLDEEAILRDGKELGKVAEETAARWRDGLASWNVGDDRLRALAAVPATIYTPGSSAGVGLNILGSLAAPAGIDWESGAEGVRAEIEGTVTGLLGLIDIEADPLTSREHILIANLIENAWRQGKALDLAALIGEVQTPPLRKLGVFEIEAFFPAKDRTALAMRLNGLAANPSFATWMSGEPIDIGRMLFGDDGVARAPIIYLSHLSASERQFVVTLLLSKVITWMQTQKGTSGLRALIYMDEVFGFVPPTAEPPAKKPILTLLKQARAFGVGLVLSTQNPVDLDYKAMSNAGTWMIGRLQTERDKARILEALKSARGDADLAALDATISGLGKRQFVLHNTREAAPALFTTRWAMSYLAGPLTKPQISALERHAARASVAPVGAAAPSTEAKATLADDETAVAPEVADAARVRYVAPSAPWLDALDGVAGGTRLEAALCARVHLVFDDAKINLDERQEFEAIWFPIEKDFDGQAVHVVDYDDRDFAKSAPLGARYVLPEAPIANKSFFASVEKDLKSWLFRDRKLEVLVNRELKLASRPGEDEAAFRTRCEAVAGELADAEAAKLQDKLATKLASIEKKESTAERQRDTAEVSHKAQATTEVVSGVGSVLSVLLGGKSSARAIAKRAASQARSASSRRAASARSRSRLGAANEKLEDLAEERQDLEADALEEIAEIDAKWTGVAAEIEAFEVGLERRDIEVAELALVWIPTE